jgi:deoxycytidylate deaminase
MMNSLINPIEAMQAAVDIVDESPHPTNKIAASLFNERTLISRTNDWPESIRAKIGTEQRIGNSSGTVHAEVRAILSFPLPTQNTSLCITDPFCPNCAKNIAEAGIKNIYIDHKGFEKDFFKRNDDEFAEMSLRIAARAGINVFKVERKLNRITPIHLVPDDFIVIEDNPIKIREISPQCNIQDWNEKNRIIHPRWGSAIAMNDDNECFGMIASSHPAIGYSKHMLTHDYEGKYNFYTEPLNRLLMGAKRYGLILDPAQIYMAQVPTAREFVNFIAAGFEQIMIGDTSHGRDADSLKALSLLLKHNLMRVN